jgi:hypothetical protein
MAIVVMTGCSVYDTSLVDHRDTQDAAHEDGHVRNQDGAGGSGGGAGAVATGGGSRDAGFSDGMSGSSGAGGSGTVVMEASRNADVEGNEIGSGEPALDGGGAEAKRDADAESTTDVDPGLLHPVCDFGQCKLVFVSASAAAANTGSALELDGLCQRFAGARKLGGVWKAWASDGHGAVSTRMTRATVPYRLLDGHVIANDWNDLTSGALRHAIDVYEDGTTALSAMEVWTGTSPSGEAHLLTCNDWTATNGTGIVGQSDMTTAGWTFARQEYCNGAALHLYCFEQ